MSLIQPPPLQGAVVAWLAVQVMTVLFAVGLGVGAPAPRLAAGRILEMSSILAVVAAATAALCIAPQVHDGDSIRCGAERVRISNIDAPELPGSPKCGSRHGYTAWCDYAAGERARAALARRLGGQRVTIVRSGTDSYGRTLALVQVNGQDVGEWLIAQGLARRWY